jgi:hypothetical protein
LAVAFDEQNESIPDD